jgi:hypothetical protein
LQRFQDDAITAIVHGLTDAFEAHVRQHIAASDHLDNWRGGRHHGEYQGVEYTLYDIDDVLMTRSDAGLVEDLLWDLRERVPEVDPAELWQTVVYLRRRHVPVREILPQLHAQAYAAALGIAFTATVKAQIRNATHLDNWRGGRHHGSFGGVEFTLYDLDDVLMTRTDAEALESALRRVRDREIPIADAQELWKTIVRLYRQRTPVSDIIAMVELYAAPPTFEELAGMLEPTMKRVREREVSLADEDELWDTVEQLLDQGVPVVDIVALVGLYATEPTLNELFPHWWRTAATTARNPRPTIEPSETVDLSPRGGIGGGETQSALLNALTKRRSHLLGVTDANRVISTADRVKDALEKLKAMRAKNDLSEHGAKVGTEFEKADVAKQALEKLAPKIETIRKRDTSRFVQMDRGQVHHIINNALSAEENVAKALDRLAREARMYALMNAPKPKVKVTSQVTATRRVGGADGIFDPGWSATEVEGWLQGQIKRSMNDKNVTDCTAVIQNHNGSTSGGGTGMSYDGRSVFHISHGFSEATDGCTVFFTKGTDGSLRIIGIGHHTSGGTARYSLDWKLANFTDATKFESDYVVNLKKKKK